MMTIMIPALNEEENLEAAVRTVHQTDRKSVV